MITIEYTRTPPQIFISQLRKFVKDPPGCYLSLEWVKAPDEEYLRRNSKQTKTVRDDRRDIMPACVIEVRVCTCILEVHVHAQVYICMHALYYTCYRHASLCHTT